MRLFIVSSLFIGILGKRHIRDESDVAEVADEGLEQENSLLDLDEYDEDGEYDIEDYYDDYGMEGSGGIMDSFMNMGKNIINPMRNLFGGTDEDDFDDYEGSAAVNEWWNSWSKQYDEDLYDTEDDPSMPHNVPLTRYPLPNLNDQGHMDMSEFGFRDTLDEYFDIFVIILSSSILLLLGCAAYSRVRNIRYLKKTYGEVEETDKPLLAGKSDE